MDPALIDEAVARVETRLGETYLGCDVWHVETGLALHGSGLHAGLLKRLTDDLRESLAAGSLPGQETWYLLDLDDDRTLVVVCAAPLEAALLARTSTLDLDALVDETVPALAADLAGATGTDR